MSVLSRYLDPEVLGQIAQRPFEPEGLVRGNLAGRTSRRSRATQSNSTGIANTFPVTIRGISTGGYSIGVKNSS